MSEGGDWKDLFKGVQQNDLDLVNYHIKNGVDINYQHPEYMTSPLIESIRLGNIEMVKFLLKNGASADEKEMFTDKMPLETAFERKNQEIYRLVKSRSSYKIKWWKKILDFKYYLKI